MKNLLFKPSVFLLFAVVAGLALAFTGLIPVTPEMQFMGLAGALAANTSRKYEIGDINTLTVASGVTIYEGALVMALKSDGTAVVASPAISTHSFAGIAIKGAAAGEKVQVKESGKVEMAVTGASAASVGAIVYASADDTLTLTASTNVPVGYVHRHVTSTTCIVKFSSSAERDIAVA